MPFLCVASTSVATYIVMGDLTVTLASTSVSLLKELGLKDPHKVEERTVNIGSTCGLHICPELTQRPVQTQSRWNSNIAKIASLPCIQPVPPRLFLLCELVAYSAGPAHLLISNRHGLKLVHDLPPGRSSVYRNLNQPAKSNKHQRHRHRAAARADLHHEAAHRHGVPARPVAEAGKDVVDFLFGVLATPVGAVASLLLAEGADAALGSVGNVYASAEKMDAAYMQGADARDALVVNTTGSSPTALSKAVRQRARYRARVHSQAVPVSAVLHVPSASPGVRGVRPGRGDVHHHGRPRRGADDQHLQPRAAEEDAIVQRTVCIGRKECLEILKVSFRSKAVLTDVFLATRKRARTEEGKS
ncbi:hypothetical protein EJB05_31460, partial [Eragrostis curvula]